MLIIVWYYIVTNSVFPSDWGYRSDDYNGGTCVVDSSFSATNRKDKVCTSGLVFHI